MLFLSGKIKFSYTFFDFFDLKTPKRDFLIKRENWLCSIDGYKSVYVA